MIVMRDTSNVHSQCSLGLLGRYFKLKLVIVSMFTLFGWARDAASATLPPWLVKTLERLSAEANFRTIGHSENVASPRRVCNKLCSSLGHKFPNAPLMVVLSPLNWLIKDQITSCERLGIKACKVEVENSTSLLEVCDYDILFASPEVLENPLVAKLLTRYCDRIIGIVIDESHCVVQWWVFFFVNSCKPTFVFSDSSKDLSYSTRSCTCSTSQIFDIWVPFKPIYFHIPFSNIGAKVTVCY